MSSPQPPVPAAPANLLAVPAAAAPAAFTGDMRAKALTHLASAISEKRVITVMQLLNRDPTLALEQVTIKPAAGLPDATQDVAVACLNYNLTPGYLFAVSHGYDPTKLLRPALIKMASDRAAAEADVGMLLTLGADPNTQEPTVDQPGIFAAAMGLAYPAGGEAQSSGVISMLLDAKASPVYPEAHNCPITTLVLAGGWSDAATRREHTLMMARLVKAGASPDRASGSLRQRPISVALGKRNGHALVALVQMNCSVDGDVLPGKKDLYGLMEANKLDDFKPAVQEALMSRQIAKAKREAAVGAAKVGVADLDGRVLDQAVAQTRRRLGVI